MNELKTQKRTYTSGATRLTQDQLSLFQPACRSLSLSSGLFEKEIVKKINSGSVCLFRLFGIPVMAHWTWFLFPFGVSVGGGWMLDRWAGAGGAFGLICLAVGSILAHELAHCLVARRFGCGTERILLIPFGMVANLERVPREPAHEWLMAAAGPATSACLAGFAWAGSSLANCFKSPAGSCMEGICYFLIMFNSIAALFNLLAIFPMDGGRILRATLYAGLRRWSRLSDSEAYVFATKLAVRAVGWPLAALVVAAMLKTGFVIPTLYVLLPLLMVVAEIEIWALRECPELFDVPDTVSFLPCPRRMPSQRQVSCRSPEEPVWGLEVVLSTKQGIVL